MILFVPAFTFHSVFVQSCVRFSFLSFFLFSYQVRKCNIYKLLLKPWVKGHRGKCSACFERILFFHSFSHQHSSPLQLTAHKNVLKHLIRRAPVIITSNQLFSVKLDFQDSHRWQLLLGGCDWSKCDYINIQYLKTIYAATSFQTRLRLNWKCSHPLSWWHFNNIYQNFTPTCLLFNRSSCRFRLITTCFLTTAKLTLRTGC